MTIDSPGALVPQRARALLAATMLAATGAAAAAPLYAVTRIAPHDPARWVDIRGAALNQVGGVAGTDVTHGRPFRWSAAGGLEWLEDLPGGEDHEARASGINDAGVVVGAGSIKGPGRGERRLDRPVAWMPGSVQARDLGAGLNPHGRWEGYAYAVNDAGLVAGVSGPFLDDHAFFFDLATDTPQYLGPDLRPMMIDEAGATAGPGPLDPFSPRGHVYQYRTPDGRRVDLPHGVYAAALNNVGQVAGSNLSFQAIVWSEAAGVTVLPGLSGLPTCEAKGLNDHGVAIGSCYWNLLRSHAVLWTPDGAGGYTAQDVRELVQPDERWPARCTVEPGSQARHCFGEDGVAINNAGQLLVNERKIQLVNQIDSEPLLLTPLAAR